MKTKILDVSDIEKNFKQGTTEIEVLKKVSLSLEEGRTLAVVGKSGSGKSTVCANKGCSEKIDTWQQLLLRIARQSPCGFLAKSLIHAY